MDKSSSTSSATGSNSSGNSGRELSAAAPGCGSSDLGTIPLSTPPPPPPPISLNITTTTGGSFTVLVDAQNSVENLKKIIAKKLKVAKDRICLLHRERELQGGNLKDNGLVDGSKIILIPNVETGLLAQRPENTVMQALESLNDAQVNDFLSGKTPLNLSMRLGDHMMLIQLQLSTVNPSSPSHTSSRSRSNQRSSSNKTSSLSSSAPTSTTATNSSSGTHSNSGVQQHTIRKLETETNNSRHNNSSSLGLEHVGPRSTSSNSYQETAIAGASTESFSASNISDNGTSNTRGVSSSSPQSMPSNGNVITSPSTSADDTRTLSECCSSLNSTSFAHESLLEQSPIKSLSNLVSSPIKTTSITNIPTITSSFSATEPNSNSTSGEVHQVQGTTASPSTIVSCSDPISAKLTSCLCKRLSNSTKNCDLSQCQTRQDLPLTSLGSPCGAGGNTGDMCSRRVMATSTPNTHPSVLKQPGNPSFLHKTANNPIVRSKLHRHHHHHSHHHHSHHHYATTNGSSGLRKSTAVEKSRSLPVAEASGSAGASSDNTSAESSFDLDESMTAISATDSRALAEASRNLTQTLRKLSKEVFTSKVDLSEETPRKNGSGAVIESMKNHGKGIYSGTFSGTLNPALQDRYGRPKRDISTVIHILNDLLSATPQYSKGARICFESPTTSKSGKIRTSTSSDACNKCYNSTKSSNCVYGECNGHYSGSSSSSSPAQTSCHRNAISSDSCSCCGQDSGLSFETSQSLTASECSSSVSSFSDMNSLSNSSSCTCTFLRNNKASTNESPNITLHDVSTNASVDKTICSKCVAEFENNKTKCKLDQLRLVMQQSKQRREARKLKGAPYGARVLSTSTTSTNNGTASTSPSVSSASSTSASATAASTIAPLASPSEVSPNHIVEEVNTVA